jgi:hypothetical protein
MNLYFLNLVDDSSSHPRPLSRFRDKRREMLTMGIVLPNGKGEHGNKFMVMKNNKNRVKVRNDYSMFIIERQKYEIWMDDEGYIIHRKYGSNIWYVNHGQFFPSIPGSNSLKRLLLLHNVDLQSYN